MTDKPGQRENRVEQGSLKGGAGNARLAPLVFITVVALTLVVWYLLGRSPFIKEGEGVSAGTLVLAAGLALAVLFALLAILLERLRSTGARLQHLAQVHELMTRAGEDRFGLMVGGIKDYAIMMLNPDGIVLSWNEGAQRLKGYAEAEIVGCSIERFYTPEDIEAGRPALLLWQAVNDGRVEDEGWRVRSDGSRFYADVVITALRNSSGELTGFAKITRDISAKKATERLQQEQEERIARLSRVRMMYSAISNLIVRARNRDELLKETCRIAVEHGDFGIVWIGMLDAEMNLNPVAAAGVDPDSFLAIAPNTARADSPQGHGMVGRVVREKRVLYTHDITLEKSKGGARRQEAIRRGYRSLFAAPLVSEGKAIGTLSLFAKQIGYFDSHEIQVLSELAESISFALDNINKAEKLATISRIREVSGEVNSAIIRIRERDPLLQEICRIAWEIGQFDLVWVGLTDHEAEQITAVAWRGFSDEAAKKVSWASVSNVQGSLYKAVHKGKLTVLNHLSVQQRSGVLRDDALRNGAQSTVCMPIVVENVTVAAVVLYVKEEDFFDDEEVALLNEMAADISFALESISRQKKLDYLAYYDPLTGLANLTLFQERVEQRIPIAKRDAQPFEVVLTDVDRFRHINETIGRSSGDELIRQIGQRFQNTVRDTDVLAHVTGDRFAIATRNLEAGNVAQVVERIMTAVFSTPFQVGDNELRITARAGIAVYPDDGDGVEILLRNAEAALEQAKDKSMPSAFYQPEMNAKVAQNLILENKLRRAIEEEQFILHYQPKVSLKSGRIDGLEALIRWQDPEIGLVPPVQFIPLLEEIGLIQEVGQWAMQRAMYDYGKWLASGLNPPRIAVNVSPVQLRRKDFADVVLDVLKRYRGPSIGLDLEITESLIMEDIEGNIERLRAVKDMGVKIAIDDFGTGYSSLGYLARLPVDTLKIDRSFIVTMGQSAENMTIVSTIISLAHALKLKVVAEGVDSDEQKNTLLRLQCDELQGYLFSRPLPAAEFEKQWLRPAVARSA